MKIMKSVDEIMKIPGTDELVYQIEGFKFKQALETLKIIKKEFEATDE